MTRCAFLIPTANPAQCTETFAAWRAMGWDRFALVEGDGCISTSTTTFGVDRYLGWSGSFNYLVEKIGKDYDWLATGGDDVLPDPNRSADQIGLELSEYFSGTFGVCQGTADAWAYDKNGTAEPICYAPIIGAEFARRWNGGKGALWPGYFHWFVDAELLRTAQAARKLWLRPDLFIEHRHVAKTGKPTPAYMRAVQHRWGDDARLYEQRKRDGFPGSEPTA